MKSLAFFLAFLLLAAACGGANTKSTIATSTPELEQPKFGYDANKALGKGGNNGGAASGAQPTPAPAGGMTTGAGSYHPPPGDYRSLGPQDDASLGYNSYFYLNRVVPKLRIEIDAVPGWAPSQSAVDLLVQRLRSVVDKPGGIEVMPYGSLPARDTWSQNDLRVFEQKSRNYHSAKSVIVLHIMYVNGSSDRDQGNQHVLGNAFSSIAFALFIQHIREGGLASVPSVDVERSDIVHETGHVLALVGIGYNSPRDHEDPAHPAHSNNANSVMYWATEQSVVFSLFQNGRTRPPTDFDADDRADLRDIRDGRLSPVG